MYTIMVIDDDESIGNMEQELLEREGYQVQHAFSGTEALLLFDCSNGSDYELSEEKDCFYRAIYDGCKLSE